MLLNPIRKKTLNPEEILNSYISPGMKIMDAGIIDARLCLFDSLMVNDLCGRIDLALAFGVLHETRDKKNFISEIFSTLKQDSVFIFGEPHVVTWKVFDNSIALIEESGFVVEEIIRKGNNNIAVMRKKTRNSTNHK